MISMGANCPMSEGVMNRFSSFLRKYVLYGILARACKASIPRSGKEGAQVNCFIVTVDQGNKPYLVVRGADGDDLICKEWDGSCYQIERRSRFNDFRLSDFRITHYYGLDTIEFNGIIDYVLNRISRWPYIKIHVYRFFDGFSQYVFNKKKFYTKQRMELLKFLVGRALDGQIEHNPIDLMTGLYSLRWFLHPQGIEQQRRVEFYLDSLVASGELKRDSYNYVVTGLALRTIEAYEEQERKHTENVKMQWRMFWLTVAVAAATVVQAELVKLPTLIDLK